MDPAKAKALQEEFRNLSPEEQKQALESLKLLEKYKLIEPASHYYEGFTEEEVGASMDKLDDIREQKFKEMTPEEQQEFLHLLKKLEAHPAWGKKTSHLYEALRATGV